MAENKNTAQKLVTLWETKREDMITGELSVSSLENLIKAAKVGGYEAVKFLGFKGFSKGGKKVLDILADPCNPYVREGAGTKTDGKKQERKVW